MHKLTAATSSFGPGPYYSVVYSLFFPGRRVRAHLQNPATKCDFPIGYFIFLLTLEKCAILQCSVLSIRSKLPFLFHRVLLFRSCFVSVLFLFRVCFVSVSCLFCFCFVSVLFLFRVCFVSVSCLFSVVSVYLLKKQVLVLRG
jgi:hypothetical protein